MCSGPRISFFASAAVSQSVFLDFVVQRRFGDTQRLSTARQIALVAPQRVGDQRALEGLDGFDQRARAIVNFAAERRGAVFNAEYAALGDVAQFANVAGPLVAQ